MMARCLTLNKSTKLSSYPYILLLNLLQALFYYPSRQILQLDVKTGSKAVIQLIILSDVFV